MIICDTGPLVALLNAADDHHEACSTLFATYPGHLVVPGPILTEVCYMTETRLGSETEARFLDSVASGEFEIALVAGESADDESVSFPSARGTSAIRPRYRCLEDSCPQG